MSNDENILIGGSSPLARTTFSRNEKNCDWNHSFAQIVKLCFPFGCAKLCFPTKTGLGNQCLTESRLTLRQTMVPHFQGSFDKSGLGQDGLP